jgi:hypothetical protein
LQWYFQLPVWQCCFQQCDWAGCPWPRKRQLANS